MMSSVLVLVLLGLGILAAGFLIGRYYIPDNRALGDKASRADAYIAAVTLLAADEDAAALERLLDVVRSHDVGEVETYFALGALFRARGEWERAIRVHQTLALRAPKEQARCTFELALDYRAAGMPKRATRAFEEVLGRRDRSYDERVLEVLAQLYEEQGRYADAADAWRKLAKLGDASLEPEALDRRHHLMIAAAQRASDAGDWDSAKRLLRDARRDDTPSAHALVAAAEIAMARGDAKGASAQLEEALTVAPGYAQVLVPGVMAAQRQLEGPRLDKELAKSAIKGEGELAGDRERELDRRTATATATVLERVLSALGRNGHIEMALAELRSFFDPVRALDDYQHLADEFPEFLPGRVVAARLALATDDTDLMRHELHALAAADGALAWAMEGSWRCAACGQRDESFFWRCHRCRAWSTAHLDVGREVLDVPTPRARPRSVERGSVSKALLGAEAVWALPEPTLESGLSADELARAGRRPSVFGRVGSWFSSAFSGRDKPAPALESATSALPAALAPADESRPEPPRALPEATAPATDAQVIADPLQAETGTDRP